jgi:eukaryotic-like serine/threonine-protein kinase
VEIGDVLRDKYIVEEVLGEGGVGIVVAAHNLELDERVALKFLRNDVMHDQDIVARFAHEAKAAVAIKSEHVARVFDVGSTPGGVPFVVMEYLEGHDLGTELAARGRLPVREAVEYAMQVCDALAAAHAKGIVHRDIKPDNLFLLDRGDTIPIVKVLDFGISKAALTGSVFGSLLPTLKTSKVMGTPLYMSPEQIQSTDDVDAKSDIWSLGMVLYELLAGAPAFEAETLEELLALIQHAALPPLAARRSDVPEGLAEILSRCMKKDPGERFQNVGELAVALLPFAPKRSRICAERACQVLWSAGLTQGRLHVSSTAPPPSNDDRESRISRLSSGQGVTSLDEHGAGMAVQVETRPPRRRAMLLVMAVAAVAAGAIAAGVALRQPTRRASSEAATSAKTHVDPVVQATSRPVADTPTTTPSPAVEPPKASPVEAQPEPSVGRATDTATAAPPKTLEPRRLTPVLVKPSTPASAPPPPEGKAKPRATADEPDLGY